MNGGGHGNSTQSGSHGGGAHKPVKRIENLPRTGIEYPFMKERRHFLPHHKEFEPLSD